VSDQVSHVSNTTGTIIVQYILIFILWTADWKTTDSALHDSKHFLTSIFS
jgi:hypothetical protein